MRMFRWFMLLGVMSIAVVPLRASDPVGIYCLVTRAVLMPNDTEPDTVQIWGAFSMSDGKFGVDNGGGYTAPAAGYLYYSCPKGKEAQCSNEWNDLKSVAGKNAVVGIGFRHAPLGRVRPATEKAGNPDVYPIAMGVSRGITNGTNQSLAQALKNAAPAK